MGLALASLCAGRYDVPINRMIAILAHHVLPINDRWEPIEQRIVELIRLPRTVEAMLVGPQIVGVSSGSALGGATAIFLSLGNIAVVGSAFLAGMAAIVCVYLIAATRNRTSTLMLVLAGAIVGAFYASLVSLVIFFANPDDSLPAIVYWLMGSFATASFAKVEILFISVLVAGVPLLALHFRINVLALGDEEARALGVRVERTRWLALTAVSILVAACVSVSGVIGWVGLVIPHFTRMLFGPNHRLVLPGSLLIGSGHMLLIDTIARTVSALEIPLGILTAIVGAPVFGLVLRRTKARGW